MSLSPNFHENAPEPEMSDVCLNLENQFSSMQELSKAEGMRVYSRVRPMLNSEIEAGYKECIAAIDDQTVRALFPSSSAKYKSSSHLNQDVIEDFTFTTAYGPETGQFVFFEECMMNTMQNFIEGQNSLVFSYGITGSGKTFTLQGNTENPGIIPLSLHLFFASIEDQLLNKIVVKPDKFADVTVLSDSDRKKELQLKEQLLSIADQEEWSYRNSSASKSFAMILCDTFSEKSEIGERQTTLGPKEMAQAQAATLMKELSRKSADQQAGYCNIWISFAEIYNENVYDLLQPNINQRTKLNLGEDKNGDVYVKGLQEVCVSDCYEALKLLNLGQKNLKIASTKLNYQSSRSHCIFSIKVVRIPDPENITHAKINRLSFCDLAGSERAAKSQTTGIRLKEAGCINTSLLVLGRCLEQLRLNPTLKDKKMVPFRESKLTRLFSGFLTGKGKAVMITNASPSELTFDETLHALRFSALAKELIINDSYIATASSTLQTITNMWTNTRANSSCSDKSISFDDSMEDVMQEKDELIEKLLDLAESLRNNLEKEKRDKAELEMKIRQEVCQEYSEYSDDLLENQKQRYEDECESVKEVYKKRISAMEQMYENIIKDYKMQLDDCESSGDEAAEKEPKNVFSENEETKIEVVKQSSEEVQSYALHSETLKNETEKLLQEIEAMKNDLLTVSEELKQTKEELRKAVDHSESLENVTTELEQNLEVCNLNLQKSLAENDELKKQNDFLEASYQEEIMSLQNEIKLNSSSSADFETQILKEKLDASYSELQNALKSVDEMKNELDALHIDVVFYKSENCDLQSAKLSLDEKVESLTYELASVKNEKEVVEQKLMEAENKMSNHNDVIHKLDVKIEDLTKMLHASKNQYEESLEEAAKMTNEANISLNAKCKELDEKREKLTILEEDIASHKQELVELQNEMNSNMEKMQAISIELDAAKLESTDLKHDLENAEQSIASLNKLISNLKAEINDLTANGLENKKRLEAAANQHEKETQDAKEVLKAVNSAFDNATLMIEEQKKKIETLESECTSLKKDMADLVKGKEDIEKTCARTSEVLGMCEKLERNRMAAARNESPEISQAEIKELTALKADCLQYKDEISALQKNNFLLEDKLSSISAELECLVSEKSQNISVMEKHVEALKVIIAQSEGQIKELKSKEQEKDQMSENLTKELNDVKQKFDSANAELKETLEIVVKQKKDCDTLEAEHITFQNVISELEESKKDLTEQISILLNKLDTMEMSHKQELDIVNAKLEEALCMVSKQEKEIGIIQNDCCTQKNEISQLQQQKVCLEEKLNSQTQDDVLLSNKQELDVMNTKLTDALFTIGKQEKELEILQNDCFAQKNEISELNQQKIDLEAKMNSQKQIDSVVLELILILENIEFHATNTIQKLQHDSTSYNEKYEILHRHIQILQKCEWHASENRKQLHKSSIDHVEQLMDLEKSNKNKESNIESLKNDLNTLQKQLKELQATSKKHLQTEKQQYNAEIGSIKNMKAKIEQENNLLKTKISLLEKEKGKLLIEAETLRNLQNKVIAENKEISIKIQNSEAARESENAKEVQLNEEKAEVENLSNHEEKKTRETRSRSSTNTKSKKNEKEPSQNPVTEKKQNKKTSRKIETIEEGNEKENAEQETKKNVQKLQTEEKQSKKANRKVDIFEDNNENENVKQKTKENDTEVLKERKVARRHLRNVENVTTDFSLVLDKDSKHGKSKASKRKIHDESFEEKVLVETTLKKIKLREIDESENRMTKKPQNLRIQVLLGQTSKNEFAAPSPRVTRGRKRMFNVELFQNKENAALGKSRRSVRS